MSGVIDFNLSTKSTDAVVVNGIGTLPTVMCKFNAARKKALLHFQLRLLSY